MIAHQFNGRMTFCGLTVCVVLIHFRTVRATNLTLEKQELAARNYINSIEEQILEQNNAEAEAMWTYESNITQESLDWYKEVQARNAIFNKVFDYVSTQLSSCNRLLKYNKFRSYAVAHELLQYDVQSFKDQDLKRRIKKLSDIGYASLPEDQFAELTDAISNMTETYATARVCDYVNRTKCDLSLESDLLNIMAVTSLPGELEYYWTQWHDVAGTPSRSNFKKYIELTRVSSRRNNFTSQSEGWPDAYEDDIFEQQVDEVFEAIRPLYEQFHAYVRYKLRKYYGEFRVSETGPIPMHLLRSLWGSTWDKIADITIPFPESQPLDVTDEMKKQGFNTMKMFEMGDEFFVSLNMTKLPQTFWDKSILEKPADGRELICHPSAVDFYKHDDVRIKQCTNLNMEYISVIHHELGHVQYFLQYQHQPSVYRDGANPGFHEAVGDVLALSVSTPKHLKRIGLLDDFVMDDKARINEIYRAGLKKIVVLPFIYGVEKYRWGVFRGDIRPQQYNCKFWEIRTKFSGIEPPVVRTEQDFDAAALFHVAVGEDYLRYFVSHVIQFQFHRAVCTLAGEYVKGDPEKTLNNCDIYRSVAAGDALKRMMAMGSSKPWPEAMEVLTGERRMSADALLEYFGDLYKWLVEENKRLGVPIGWGLSNKCKSS